MPKAVVLLSGGLDSATCLAIAQSQGFSCYCMSFDYGQRHRVELDRAARTAKGQDAAEHRVVKIDSSAFAGSALTDDIDVPKSETDGIPVTYVPARNTVFLSYALAWAEALEARDIFIGVNALDYSGYPDCRPEYIAAFERMANLATKAAVEGSLMTIHTPLIDKTKAETIKIGVGLGVDYGLTSSCYDPDEEGGPCGECDSCRIRARGFEESGMQDPLIAR